MRGLDFNMFLFNLFVSGVEDGEFCIWDLVNSNKSSLYFAFKFILGGLSVGEVLYLVWNYKV